MTDKYSVTHSFDEREVWEEDLISHRAEADDEATSETWHRRSWSLAMYLFGFVSGIAFSLAVFAYAHVPPKDMSRVSVVERLS